NVRTNARTANTMAALAASLLASTAALSAPAIRTNEKNSVPSCVSPDRLMAFLEERNGSLDPKYRDIARWYKHWGEAWNVRWDYAFFQMALETNYLKYKRGNGRRGDVHEKQNNFAGIGATGGGVAGERFADVKTGVHAQIQHLVAYSGERVEDPVAKRTDENQDSIIEKSRRLRRPVTFGDLARRWAADRQYAKSIDVVATMFREGYCHGPATAGATPASAQQAAFARPSALGGPKPQRLAGPEALPWGDGPPSPNKERATAQTEPQPNVGEPQQQGSPVRTLWSRGKGFEARPEGSPDAAAPELSPAALPQPETLQQPAGRPSSDEQARPAGSMSSEPQSVGVEVKPNELSGQSAENAPVELPTFHIAPRKAEPSRLGGPIPTEAPSTSVSAAPPQGTFVEFEPPKPANRQKRVAVTAAAAGVPKDLLSDNPPPTAPKAKDAAAPTGDCRILTASYGGKTTLLVHAEKAGVMQLTALTVLDGFEDSMLASYAKIAAPGARVLGTYDNKADALSEAKAICPQG
ncbi:MAG: hypothetical protein ABL907_12440, partial [Hyphomicrobium sp.]